MRNNNTKENRMAYNAIKKVRRARLGDKPYTDFQKIVKHLKAKGYSESDARREAQKCTTELALAKKREHLDNWFDYSTNG